MYHKHLEAGPLSTLLILADGIECDRCSNIGELTIL